MAGTGITQAAIASAIGLAEPALRKHYRFELDNGSALATAKVAGNLFRMACGERRESVTAAIFWMKTRGKWRKNHEAVEDVPTEIIVTVRRVGTEPRCSPIKEQSHNPGISGVMAIVSYAPGAGAIATRGLEQDNPDLDSRRRVRALCKRMTD